MVGPINDGIHYLILFFEGRNFTGNVTRNGKIGVIFWARIFMIKFVVIVDLDLKICTTLFRFTLK